METMEIKKKYHMFNKTLPWIMDLKLISYPALFFFTYLDFSSALVDPGNDFKYIPNKMKSLVGDQEILPIWIILIFGSTM